MGQDEGDGEDDGAVKLMGRARVYLDEHGVDRELVGHDGWLDAEIAMPGQPPQWAGGGYNRHTVATGRYRPVCECGWVGPVFDGHDPSSPWPPSQLWPDGEIDPYLPDAIDDELMGPWQTHTDALLGVESISAALVNYRTAEDQLGMTIARAVAAGTSWDTVARRLRLTESEAIERWSAYSVPEPDTATTGDVGEWWDNLGAILGKVSIHDKDLAVSTGLYDGQPKISPGRSEPGWERRAVEAMAMNLHLNNFTVQDVVDVDELWNDGDGWRPPLGGIHITHDGTTVLIGVRIDDVGEIYASIDDPNDPRNKD